MTTHSSPSEPGGLARPDEEAASRPVALCPTIFPEPHRLGEFPMTCYRCHLDADS